MGIFVCTYFQENCLGYNINDKIEIKPVFELLKNKSVTKVKNELRYESFKGCFF